VFRNRSGTIRFTLVVDDFAMMWTNQSDMDHFIHTLTRLYDVKVNWQGSKYLDMDITINRDKRHVTLTMPGYIQRLLQRVRPNGVKGASTSAQYTPPNYANPGAQKVTIDASPLASESDKKILQSMIGTLLYYCRAVDPSICTAVHQLGSVQANPTETDMANMERLLRYVSTHQNNGIRYYASEMVLQLMSDASYQSSPKARSVCGYDSYLGSPNAINRPISCGSWMINCVCGSVAEAKLAGEFQAAQTATHHRAILSDLGYPQPPTMLRMDNTVAIGIAAGQINAKRSKSMDMRFFWLVDRVKQRQFVASHIPGIWNIADHFTKPLPKQKFNQLTHFLVVDMDNEPTVKKPKTITVTFRKAM
jgi:hypothetical protein